MAIVSAGYDGTVDETQFAKLLNRYSVVGPNDFEATNVAGDRTITISGSASYPSQALGPGLYDSAADLGTFQFNAATGTRWDLVVLRRDWQPPGGATSIRIIEGGASKSLPTRSTTPGVEDDQPLYLQRVDGTLLGERVDLRLWNGPGGCEARDDLVRSYLAIPGAEVKIGQAVWRYAAQANNQWAWEADYGIQVDGVPSNRRPIIKSGNVEVATNAAGDFYITFDTAFPTRMVSFTVNDTTDPRYWQPLILKNLFIYSDRFRLGCRVYDHTGAVLKNRTGVYVSYNALGY